jgi:urease accessory protein
MHVPPVPLPTTPAAAEPGRPTPSAATLLMLTDSRLPSGAYAHSGGLEPLAVTPRRRRCWNRAAR